VAATVADMHPGYLAAGLLLQFVPRAITALRMKGIADGGAQSASLFGRSA